MENETDRFGQFWLFEPKYREIDADNIVIITVGEKTTEKTIVPVLRAWNEVSNVLEGTTEFIYKTEVDFIKFKREPKRIIQIYDTYYFPHNWLVNLYNKFTNAQIYYFSFDYLSAPYSTVAKIFRERGITIGNSQKIIGLKPHKYCWLNLNALLINDKIIFKEERKYDIIYWGRFRNHRKLIFEKYLTDRIIISCSGKNVEKFKEINPRLKIIDKLDWETHDLADYKASLYLEDPETQKIFNYFGARWYEALNCGLITYFAEECKNTIKKSGYNIPEKYIIKSTDDIPKDIVINKQLIEQWHKKALKEKEECINQLREVFKL